MHTSHEHTGPSKTIHPQQRTEKGVFFQPKLSVNEPGDKYEQEADAVAEQVVQEAAPAASPAFFQPSLGAAVQRKCAECEEEEKKMQRKPMADHITPLVQRKPEQHDHAVDGATESTLSASKGGGQSLPPGARSHMENQFGTDFSDVSIHTGSQAASLSRDLQAQAFTVGKDIYFNEGKFSPETRDGKRLLAHELTHVVQQTGVNRKMIQCDGVPQTPHDRALVARARARLAVIEPMISQLSGRRLSIEAERLRVLADRRQLDDTMVDLTGLPGSRQRAEDAFIAGLNRRPLSIAITDTAVVFSVRFHVRFEDASMRTRFTELTQQVQAGIDRVWTQTLTGAAFGGRRFTIAPTFTEIDMTTPRDTNFWLITIRDNDMNVATYSGCALPATTRGIPTSVTDATCDGGVMSIPPRHIARPDVLGHELMHLFGLIDRYVSIISQPTSGPPTVVNDPLRETRGRRDPLGAESGTILREDLGYLFDRLGVYGTESDRSTAALPMLEREAMRLREIVRLGRDPNSLIRIRRGFTDRMIRDAEDL